MLDNNKSNLLLCITGSIAAYKSVDLARLFLKNNFNVRVIMTEASKEFITPLTLQAISGNQVHDNLLDEDAERAMGHIELAKWADLILIAPCSAETISRLAHGRADDLLSAVILASQAQKFIAPAMNMNMWSNQMTQENVEYLSSTGIDFVGPSRGDQACGDSGYGRMSEPDEIFETIMLTQSKPLTGKKIIITAGPTREQIDPVRFISNNSSGKMGFAMAEAALRSGAEVILITGPVSLSCSQKIQRVDVQSADEMYMEAQSFMPEADIFIGCAAVADFKPTNKNTQKIKKIDEDKLNIELQKNIDIIASLASKFRDKRFMGFCAETERVEEHAKSKLIKKGLDFIVANDVSKSDIGFDSDFNEVSVFTGNSHRFFQKASKRLLAIQLVNLLSKDSQLLH
jgi:phosphopantothenoylcysteine decarboxylase/phosphopantothenate--cysteine ligase